MEDNIRYITYNATIKETGEHLENLIAFYDFEENSILFIENLFWVDGYELSGKVYCSETLEDIKESIKSVDKP